jgi:hypothetical protein
MYGGELNGVEYSNNKSRLSYIRPITLLVLTRQGRTAEPLLRANIGKSTIHRTGPKFRGSRNLSSGAQQEPALLLQAQRNQHGVGF